MKKTLAVVIIISALLPVVLIVSFFYSNHEARQNTAATLQIDTLENLDEASFNLNKTSAVTSSFSVSPSLSTKPISTNKWWQNAVAASPWPDPLFNIPLATTINEKGISIGAPPLTVAQDIITAPATSDVLLNAGSQASRTSVSAFDDVSVTIQGVDSNNEKIYSLLLAKGSPFVFVNLTVESTIDTSSYTNVTLTTLDDKRNVLRFTSNGNAYAVYTPSTASMNKEGNQVTIQPTEELVIAHVLKDASPAVLKIYDEAAKATIISTSVDHSIDAKNAKTALTYKTLNGEDTLLMVLPHQQKGLELNGANEIGTITTIRGQAKIIKSKTITYTTPVPKSDLVLALPKESSYFKKDRLEQYLRADLPKATVASVSYDGGKELYRLANLTMIAKESKSSTAEEYQASLKRELTNWLTYDENETSKYFYYDKKIKGLVAAESQYGSEVFNDHHFHYGYFLYAASVLATYDKSFVTDFGKAVSYIGQDIASNGSNLFPRLRTYDAYDGHSWAGGLSPFKDGNNQESISEAVNAWFGLYSWASAANNVEQRDTAAWLYANEANAATTYYYKNTSNPFPVGYKHSIASLLWGGKTEYATWFSAQPEAKHAILMLPISGGSTYLKQDNAIRSSIAELDARLGATPRSAYQDILLLGQSLQDPSGAQSAFNETVPIDNSNSLSYLYYYLAWAGEQ